MRRKFRVKVIPCEWIRNDGHRLDCGPYLSGALDAKELLCKIDNEPLRSITNGIFHAGRESRMWVGTAEYGVPFLGSTDILATDYDNLPFIAKKQVESNPVMILYEGMSLITRSGTIGRMAYCRADMDGLACSEHVMRVVPNGDKVKSGYLYAFLSSRFGVPIVVSGTYGSIIQSIEPQHIEDLPVPRLGTVEQQAHELVQRAADLRVEANQLLKGATADLELEIGGGHPIEWEHRHVQSFAVETKMMSKLSERLDAFHHIGYVNEAISKADVEMVPFNTIGGKALLPPFLKRIWVEEGGYEFLGGSELMTLEQRSEQFISKKIPTIAKFIVHEGYVLFPCVGQRYGIFGTPVLANRHLIGKAVSQAVMRLIPEDIRDAGYVSVFLATGFGRRLSMRFSAGTSIPALSEDGAAKTLIYWPDETRRHTISYIAEKAWENRALATDLEDQARALVEHAIEEGGR